MYYVDSQRTLTRRESSLIADKENTFSEGYDTGRTRSTGKLQSESITSLPRPPRPPGSVRRELVTMMFESMLDCIVDSWDVIPPPVIPEPTINVDMNATPSEVTSASKKTKKGGKEPAPPPSGKHSKTKRSRSSKLEVLETREEPYHSWWSSPDERAVIRFKNGNMYEGNISMKRMHGEGRFQWANGTVYLGHFKDNAMHGKGLIQWKDDTWYEGEFVGNLRHGRGLYVNSRQQAFYSGGWHCGAKHGKGLLHFPCFKNNSYDGDWQYNIRHGYGLREYSHDSGYAGDWEWYIREGSGLMIWPNHDLYMGGWKNGVMSGHGTYFWETHNNNTMALPSISGFHGLWNKGERNGSGLLNFGLGLGSHYKGGFKDNKKHGHGKLVTNNGMIMRNKELFVDDILGPVSSETQEDPPPEQAPQSEKPVNKEPFQFDICNDAVGLMYHIEQAFKNIDCQIEKRTNMISEYIENNKLFEPKLCIAMPTKTELCECYDIAYTSMLEDTVQFEEKYLRQSLRNYETDLKNIYDQYATICNTEDINFPPIMLRLYLWQFYYDCNIHNLGLTLIEVDRMFHACPEWLSRNPHDPFEKIYFWQFLHSLISVASRLYAKKQLPGVRPNTIVSTAFDTFMNHNALPGRGLRKGFLVNGFGCFVPLKGAYELYQLIGEPHTVRQFICATRHPPHYQVPQPALEDSPDDTTPIGRNVYIFGNKMTFIAGDPVPFPVEDNENELRKVLKLFNFGNLSSKSIIKIFSHIFPKLCSSENIMDLDIEMTFYEFFEGFISCAQKSIRVKEEEMQWKDKISVIKYKLPKSPGGSPNPHSTATARKA